MKGKRRMMLIVLLTVLLATSAVYWILPRPLFKSTEQLEIYLVEAVGEDGQEKDITDTVDVEGLKECVTFFYTRRMPDYLSYYMQSDVAYRIDGLCGEGSFAMIVGNVNYAFIDGHAYPIYQGQLLVKLIDALTARQERL